MLLRRALPAAGALSSVLSGVSAIELNPADQGSIQAATNQAVENAFVWYVGPGQLGDPYYWWEAGAFLGLLIQRWSIFGDDNYNSLITEGIMAQIGEHQNFEPDAQRLELGNDDQAFWAFTVLDAAEQGFPDAPEEMGPSWLGLAQAVFNRQTLEWDETQCGGGMRWQKFFQNAGYDYKNAPTNAAYFMISARLARYTGNDTYVQYADRMFDWIENGNFWVLEDDGLHVYDGVHIQVCDDPTQHNPGEWTYNVGMLIMGAAYMFDLTPEGSRKDYWEERIRLLLDNSERWFYEDRGANSPPQAPNRQDPGIMAEAACEFGEPQTCNDDQPAFKGFTTRWFAMTAVLAPFTREIIEPRLNASAVAAARQCVGQAQDMTPGTVCGTRWYQSAWDGNFGVGEQMSAASAFQSLLIPGGRAPLTAERGGTSRNDPGLGNEGFTTNDGGEVYTRVITTGDRAGAGILTVLGLSFVVGGGAWMVIS